MVISVAYDAPVL